MIPRGLQGGGNERWCFMETEFPFLHDEGCKDDGGDGCITKSMYLLPLSWTLKNGHVDQFPVIFVHFTTRKIIHVQHHSL